MELLNLKFQLGIVAKSVLIILMILSLISWTIILEKYRFFKRHKKVPWTINSIPNLEKQGITVLTSQGTLYSQLLTKVNSLLKSNEPSFSNSKLSLEFIMNSSIAQILRIPEKNLSLLATIVSISPFLGLLGTVWGIMDAFMSINVAGTSNLSNLGPGISEALITTIFGLVVAIPALVAYNIYIGKIKIMERDLNEFLIRRFSVGKSEIEYE